MIPDTIIKDITQTQKESKLGHHKIKIICYADDVVIVVENEADVLYFKNITGKYP